MAREERWGGADTGAATATPGAWLTDPTGRYALRWWDGVAWTGHVARPDGASAVDPNPVAAPAPTGLIAPAPAPSRAADPSAATGVAAWERRPARPLVPLAARPPSPAGLVLVVAGLVGLGLSLFAFSWLSFSPRKVCEQEAPVNQVQFCSQLTDATFSVDRADIIEVIDQTEDRAGDGVDGPGPIALAYLRWGGAAGLVVVLVASAAARGRVVSWLVVAGLSGALAVWHGAAIRGLGLGEADRFLTFGAQLGWIGMLVTAAGAVVLHLGLVGGPARR